MPLTLRRRLRGDRQTVVSWLPDADAVYLFSGPQLQWPVSVAQLSENESKPGHTAWVALDRDEVSGHFELTLAGADVWLSRVIVAPERRGRGLSRELVGLALTQAGELGAASVGLRVIATNQPAIRTYLRAGFHFTDAALRPDVREMRAALR